MEPRCKVSVQFGFTACGITGSIPVRAARLLLPLTQQLWLAKVCGRRYDISMEKVVKRDPEILGGEPVFVGTRVPIESLFDHLEAGDSIADFLEGFPSVKREQVLALLEESKAHDQ